MDARVDAAALQLRHICATAGQCRGRLNTIHRRLSRLDPAYFSPLKGVKGGQSAALSIGHGSDLSQPGGSGAKQGRRGGHIHRKTEQVGHEQFTNQLHRAIGNHDEATVLRLIDGGDTKLLTTRNNGSRCTPLMLLAQGNCDEAILWKMLGIPDVVATVAHRSRTRRSAAEYAEEHGRSLEIVTQLKSLERAELSRTAGSRCSGCGDLVRARPRLAYYADRVAKGEEDNPLLKDFFERGYHKEMCKPQYHRVNSMGTIRKELTESLGLLAALRRVVPGFDSSYHVVDLCCGKMLTASIIRLQCPDTLVTGLDKLERRFLPTCAHANETGGYRQLDVLGPDFIPLLEAMLVDEGDHPVVLLGMHLCGLLSVRAVEAFQKIGQIKALLLAPCCLPRKGLLASASHLYGMSPHLKQHQGWASLLETMLRDAVPAAAVSLEEVPEILSDRNSIICGTKCL